MIWKSGYRFSEKDRAQTRHSIRKGRRMRGRRWFIISAFFLMAVATVASHAENEPQAAPSAAPKEPAPPPSVTIIAPREAHDVLVDRSGIVRAAVIDFGGFLGVGSRKIVVDWNALHFGQIANKDQQRRAR